MNFANSIINGFKLIEKIGEGGMAEVWFAKNEIGKSAAVKILKKELSLNKDIVERFRNEAKIMLKLEHPNIRQVYDFATINEQPCIIMEYLEGEDLKQLLLQGYKFNDEQLVEWWNQLVDALNYTHQKKIVHRDIKPSNLFLTKDGKIKVMDFGVAKIKDSISATQTGSHIGTVLYMSPEQVRDSKNIDYKTDIYSLAVTYYHLLTEIAPYDITNSSIYEIQSQIVNKELNTDNIPECWKKQLNKYFIKDPSKRYNLCKIDYQKEFVSYKIQQTKSNSKNPIWLIISIILFVILLVLAAYYYYDRNNIVSQVEKLEKENIDLEDSNDHLLYKLTKIEDYSFAVGEYNNLQDGNYDDGYYMHFTTYYPVNIKSVYVKSNATGSIKINIYDIDGDLVDEADSYYLSDSYTWTEIPVNISIPYSGDYYMAYSGPVELYYASSGHNFHLYNNGIIEITGCSNSKDDRNSTSYYQYFFSWKLNLLVK
jgi:serine/threonine protein kinase